MGDRANVQFRFGADEPGRPAPFINLYAHWAGESLHRAAIDALMSDTAQARYGDDSYLCRILVSRIFAKLGVDPDDASGFGLNPVGPDDNEHPIMVIDVVNSTVEYDGQTVPFAEAASLRVSR